MIGHKMGEFAITKVTGRKIAQRKLAKLKKKKRK
jgi:ribosomal protein S19